MKRLIALLFLLISPAFSGAATQPVVMGLSMSNSAPLLYIGASMTVHMSVVVPSQTVPVTVTAATSGTITLGSPAFLGMFAPTTVYITDGIRTWRIDASGGNPTVTIGDGNLLFVGAPFIGADYSTLVNSTFRAYTGTLVTNTGGSLYADLGTFDTLALSDQGGADITSGDGVWTGLYFVRDLGFSIENGKIFGQAIVSGQLASNGPYQSVDSFDMDAILPAIDWQKITTGNPDYKGMLYLSSLSQGSNVFQPTNDAARFEMAVNKRGVVVDITVGTPSPKLLTPVIVPSGAATLNAFKVWNGDDGNNLYVADGTYPVTYTIRDINGVQGVTVTSQITVTSLRMQIKNAVLSPTSLVVNPNRPADWTDPVTLTYRIELYNESGTSITSAMNVLGFPGNEWGLNTSVASTVVGVHSLNFLTPAGTPFTVTGGGFDRNSTSDGDDDILVYFKDAGFLLGDCFEGLAPGASGTTSVVGSVVHIGDGDNANDNDSLLPGFQSVVPGPNSTLMRSYKWASYQMRSDSSTSLRMSIIEDLAGFAAYTAGDIPSSNDTPDFCNGSVLFSAYRGHPIHFAPDSTVGRIRARDTTLVFNINEDIEPTLDTSPPLIISTNPLDQTTFGPGSFGVGLPITVQVQDPESNIDPSTNTRIEVRDPNGSLVGGNSATSGGGTNNSSLITFEPFASLNTGGQYKIMIYACNTAALCLEKEIIFTVRDQTAPGVSSIELVSATQAGSIPLTLFQSAPDGLFDTITEVWVTLSMPPSTTNSILWDLSTVSLEQVSGTARITVPMTRISPLAGSVPSDGRLRYRLNSPITNAGLYEVIAQTYSEDASGTQYTGPAAFTNPQFQTQVNNAVLSIRYPDNTLALTGTHPIYVTFTASNFTPSNSNPAARVPDYTAFVANTGFSPLVSAVSSTGLQFVVGGVPQTQPATWSYPAGSPLRGTLYYNNSDLPVGVLNSDLRVYGFNGSAWVPVASASYIHTFTNVTSNTFVIDLPNGSNAMAVYGIFYPALAGNSGGQATPTAIAFKDTRSFNPTHRDPLYRRARIYYSETAATSVEARVYDTAGQLLRTLSVGDGIQLTDLQTDAAYGGSAYYFEWDGRNDSGTLARNGLYLIRWKVVRLNGTTEFKTRPVALIK